jgi:hypothetical protein
MTKGPDMSRHALPDAVSDFLSGVTNGDTARLSRGLALSVVAVEADSRYRGAAGIGELLATSPVFQDAGGWDVIYTMDSEAVIESPRGDRVHVMLDCGRIAFLKVTRAEGAASLAA